jgi:hypothetical protein
MQPLIPTFPNGISYHQGRKTLVMILTDRELLERKHPSKARKRNQLRFP